MSTRAPARRAARRWRGLCLGRIRSRSPPCHRGLHGGRSPSSQGDCEWSGRERARRRGARPRLRRGQVAPGGPRAGAAAPTAVSGPPRRPTPAGTALASAGDDARRSPYGLPLALLVAGMIVWATSGRVVVAVGAMFISAATADLLLNALYRIGVEGDKDRDREDEARRFFDEHGRWPDEPESASRRSPRAARRRLPRPRLSPSCFPRISFITSSVPPPIGPRRVSRSARPISSRRRRSGTPRRPLRRPHAGEQLGLGHLAQRVGPVREEP